MQTNTINTTTINNPFGQLKGLRKILTAYERKITIKHGRQMPKITKGYIVPLPCVKYDSGRWTKVTPVYTKTERGSSVILATLHHNFTFDGPVAMRDNKKPGLRLFLNETIDPDRNLIGFVVIERLAKSAVVRAIYGTDEELFDAYEKHLAS